MRKMFWRPETARSSQKWKSIGIGLSFVQKSRNFPWNTSPKPTRILKCWWNRKCYVGEWVRWKIVSMCHAINEFWTNCVVWDFSQSCCRFIKFHFSILLPVLFTTEIAFLREIVSGFGAHRCALHEDVLLSAKKCWKSSIFSKNRLRKLWIFSLVR